MATLHGFAEWVGLAAGALIAASLIVFLVQRRRLISRVEKELGRECTLLVTGASMGFAAEQMERGLLMLLATGLYFHSWFANRELFIPGPSITYIGVSDPSPGARRFERRAVVLRFLNTAGKEDGLFVRLLYPEQWVTAIKTHLITRS
jgi:hypothetical protein